jgi:hypothetical protein
MAAVSSKMGSCVQGYMCRVHICMDRWGSIGCGLEAVAYWRVDTFLVLRHGRQGLCWCSARRVHRHCHRAASGLVVHRDGDALYLAASIISPMRLACCTMRGRNTGLCVCLGCWWVGERDTQVVAFLLAERTSSFPNC